MNYDEALSWIHGLYRFGSNLGLERINKLMAMLGNPQDKFRSVHIAGTNGKGSTAAFLAEILQAEGLRVGLYTSPYIEAFTNRMAVNGHDIAPGDLVRIVKKVKPLVEELTKSDSQPTEFEVVTALAFTYFAESKPDFVVVEVGLGGRLDATNVVRPEVTTITNIALEHTQVLGDSIAAIAREKAGIIKPGVPLVTAAEKEEALAVFRETAQKNNARMWQVGKEFTYRIRDVGLDGLSFDYQSPWRKLDDLRISMLGRHQARNATLALAVRELMPLPFNEQAARDGLLRMFWPGRLEVFSQRPLVLVDGAHNVDGVMALRTALHDLLGGRRLRMVLGILGDKAIEEMLELIIPLADAGIIVTAPQSLRASDPWAVAEKVRKYARTASVAVVPAVEDAVRRAVAGTAPDEALCVFGSLYTVSEARPVLKELAASGDLS